MNHDEIYEQVAENAAAGAVREAPPVVSNRVMLGQVQAFGDVAREADKECPKGQEAEKEMARRKNSSGQ